MILRLCLLSPHRERRCQSTACALWHERIKDWQEVSPPGPPRYFDFKGHCGTPQWRGTGPSARQYREPSGARPEFFLGKSAGTWIPEPTILDKGLRSRFVSRQSAFYPTPSIRAFHLQRPALLFTRVWLRAREDGGFYAGEHLGARASWQNRPCGSQEKRAPSLMKNTGFSGSGDHSTVTLLARLRGLSMSHLRARAM